MHPNLLSGCCKEQVGVVEVMWIVLRMSRRVEPSLQSAGAAVGEVAHPWPWSPRNLVFCFKPVLSLEARGRFAASLEEKNKSWTWAVNGLWRLLTTKHIVVF